MVGKLYLDNAEGRLDDDRLRRLVEELEKESAGLKASLARLRAASPAHEVEENYRRFFALAREYTQIQELTRDILLTFVERIEVGPKEYPGGAVKATHRGQPYRQSIRIFYRFIGEQAGEAVRELPAEGAAAKADAASRPDTAEPTARKRNPA